MTSINRIYSRLSWLSPSVLLVIANVAIFIMLRIIAIVIRFAGMSQEVDSIVDWLLLPSSFVDWVHAPWTALTYMLVQYEPMHLLMNMLWLYMFGNILDKFVSRSRFFAVYFIGGIAGAIAYLAVGAVLGSSSAGLTGASASILAIVAAAIVTVPNLKLRLFFFGEATMKVVGMIAVALFIITSGVANYTTQAAHIGGLISGAVMAYAMRENWFALNRKNTSRTILNDSQCDASLNQLLDKIRRSGFSSLTQAERVRLIKISSELQKRSNEDAN